MPGIFYQPVTRKQFLKQLGGMAALLTVPYPSIGRSPQKEVHWALLSDTHIPENKLDAYRNFQPYQNLTTVVPQVMKSQPQGVLINGDVARLTGELGDYQNVKALLNPLARQAPVYMTMGNHDDRTHFYAVFSPPKEAQKGVEDKHILVIEADPVRLILLDSLMYVDKTPGLLGKAQRTWLAAYLKQSDRRPTLLFVHHTLGDGDTDLLDVERMFAIVKPFPQVKAIFYGHSHTYQYDTLEGIHLVNQPAVGYNFSDDQPVGWLQARFTAEGAALTLQAFGGNTQHHQQTKTLSWR